MRFAAWAHAGTRPAGIRRGSARGTRSDGVTLSGRCAVAAPRTVSVGTRPPSMEDGGSALRIEHELQVTPEQAHVLGQRQRRSLPDRLLHGAVERPIAAALDDLHRNHVPTRRLGDTHYALEKRCGARWANPVFAPPLPESPSCTPRAVCRAGEVARAPVALADHRP